jgi:hypothetical protein
MQFQLSKQIDNEFQNFVIEKSGFDFGFFAVRIITGSLGSPGMLPRVPHGSLEYPQID